MQTLVNALNVHECSERAECILNVARMNAALYERMWFSQNAAQVRMHSV